jgi:hypothetical protein
VDSSRDFKDLLQAFAEAQVRYMIIGGYAVAFHGYPRFTKDIDLWIAGDPENRARARFALEAFGAPANIASQLAGMADNEILYFGVPPGRVDVLLTIPGVEFEAAFKRAERSSWGEVEVVVIGRDDLIAAKRAAGRAVDLADADALAE